MNLTSQIHPKISIVTPSFNQGQFLEQTILSIINQDYPNLEYIIIDGGSTDNSVDIIKKYEHKLHYWCSESDNGHYDAINKGFSKATGDVFAWLNSDDLYCPWALQTVGSIFSQHQGLRWLTTLNQLVWDKYGHCVSLKPIPGYSKDAFLAGCYFSKKGSSLGFIQQESTFWRRCLWKEVDGLNPEYPLAGDFDLWSRFYRHAELYGTSSPLGGFRIHDRNRSIVMDGYSQEAERSLKNMRKKAGWKVSFGAKIAAYALNKTKRNHQMGYFWRKALPKYTASNVIRDLSDDDNRWKIVTQKFSGV